MGSNKVQPTNQVPLSQELLASGSCRPSEGSGAAGTELPEGIATPVPQAPVRVGLRLPAAGVTLCPTGLGWGSGALQQQLCSPIGGGASSRCRHLVEVYYYFFSRRTRVVSASPFFRAAAARLSVVLPPSPDSQTGLSPSVACAISLSFCGVVLAASRSIGGNSEACACWRLGLRASKMLVR